MPQSAKIHPIFSPSALPAALLATGLVAFALPGNTSVTAGAAPAGPASASVSGAGDARFGLVGTGGAAFAAKFGIRYYTLEGNYAADKGALFSSVDPANDPAPGFSVVREVAKLNVRTDGLGQSNAQFQAKFSQYGKDLTAWYLTPSWARGAKPAFVWYSPDAEALARAESLQIAETIKREKARSPAITGTVWEIGNEPDLFPAITPSEYAAIFAAYRRIIKAQDPQAVVAMGSLFLPEPAEDIKARLGDELATRMRAELETAGYYNTLNNLGLFNPLVNDMKSTLLARMLALPAREYLRQVLAATTARPDIVSLHAYPFDDRAPFLDSAAMRHILDTTLAGIESMLVSQGAVAAGSPAAAVPLWITEFGNIEQELSAPAAADRSRRLIDAFRADSGIGMWFHYKSAGSDEQFSLFASGSPPLTRLSLDAGFAPVDGNFSCTRLNAVGLMYWRESHAGAECRDPVLRPAILNPEASALSKAVALTWGWESVADPGLQSATVFASVEIYRDTAVAPLFRADSLMASSVAAVLDAGSGPVWVRVRVADGAGGQTPWSAWRMLNWQAAPSAIAVPARATLGREGFRFRWDFPVDVRGRMLKLPPKR